MATDSTNGQFVRLPQLTGSSDYNKWCLGIEGAARQADLWDVLNGTETCPTAVTPTATNAAEVKEANIEIRRWKSANQKSIGLM